MDFLRELAGITGGIGAAIVILASARAALRRTLLRRFDLKRRLCRLGINVQAAYFEDVLGASPAFRRREEISAGSGEKHDTLTWVDRLAYVVALVDREGTVRAYSVTTRRRFFRPELRPPRVRGARSTRLLVRAVPGKWSRSLPEAWMWRATPLFQPVQLCRTTFAAIGEIGAVSASVGARHIYFHEAHYYGNPGLYQHFVYSINDSGYLGRLVLPQLPQAILSGEYSIWDSSEDTVFSNQREGLTDLPEVLNFRRHARPNTYTVTSDPAVGGVEFGPTLDFVRTLP